MAELPKKIDLGAIIFDVEVIPKLVDDDDKKRLIGQIKHSLSRIQLDADAEVQAMATTMMHEIMHYFIVEFGQDKAIDPLRMEGLVNALSAGMTILIRRNPDLITFMQELDNVCR